MPAPDLSSFKVAGSETSSATKFNNLVQAIQDEFGDIDPDQIPGYPSDASKFLRGDGTWAVPGGGGAAPTGAVVQFAGSSAPTDWLMCDGAAVSRATYAALFGVIAGTYGNGDGSTTFNVPDLRGRVPVGKGSNALVNTLGNNDGVTEANRRPKHRHTAHSHNINLFGGGASSSTVAGGNASPTSAVSSSTADGGSGNANDSLDAPAYLVVNYIIKT